MESEHGRNNPVKEALIVMHFSDNMVLPIVLGKIPGGQSVIRDLARIPQLLIAGATGSGKSMFLHNLICSFAQNDSPEQVRFVLMDPKRVEFEYYYAKLPHLYSPIVHSEEQGVTVLKRVEAEMNRRLAAFAERGYRSIDDFNRVGEGETLPRLVVVVDEFSDFMVHANEVFEPTVSRIAVMGRSAGVHLVLATSRPDRQVFPDSIMANIPGRLAFRLSRSADSRRLLGEDGAEELLGRGDALLKDSDGTIIRLQVPDIQDEVIKQIVDSAIACDSERIKF